MSTAGYKNDEIRNELKHFSWKTISLFEEMFPCANDRALIEIYTKEYINDDTIFPYLLTIESNEDFWKRWNRFKTLKVFL